NGHGCAGGALGAGNGQSGPGEEAFTGGGLLLALRRGAARVLQTRSRGRDRRAPRNLCHLLCRPCETDARRERTSVRDGRYGMAVAQLVQLRLALGGWLRGAGLP